MGDYYEGAGEEEMDGGGLRGWFCLVGGFISNGRGGYGA